MCPSKYKKQWKTLHLNSSTSAKEIQIREIESGEKVFNTEMSKCKEFI